MMDLSALPLYMKDFFGYHTGLFVATLLGFGFGFVLERSGFGRAPLLAAQFYFKEMRVLKVMFSAIVTALLGTTVLSGVGLLDLSAMQIPETYLWSQIVGGFILGVGFIISGYCPGTCIVSAGSGNIDGAVALLGVIIGSTVFGLFPEAVAFSESAGREMWRLPDLLHVPQALVAFAVAMAAMVAFMAAEVVERWMAGRLGTEVPASPAHLRRFAFAAFGVAAGLGLLTVARPASALPGATGPRPPGQVAVVTLEPLDLARMLVEDPRGVRLVDMRDEASARKTILGAVAFRGKDGGTGLFKSGVTPATTLVLFGADTLTKADIPAEALRSPGTVRVLRGGYPAFDRDVLQAPAVPKDPTPADLEHYRITAALHGYFTGAATAPAPAMPVAPKRNDDGGGGTRKKGGGC